MSRLAVFAYGSLVSRASVAETLGHDATPPAPARLSGWRRRWSLVRDNARAEKGFAPIEGDPFEFCLGLNLERASDAGPGEWPNGALIELTATELERLDIRELRYDRVEVTEQVRSAGAAGLDAVFTYRAKSANYAPRPPRRAVVLASYLRACEAAFEELGPDELVTFGRTTGPVPVPVVEARLVRDEIPEGNPRAW
jgi:cation transport regulator ChaC